MSRQDEKMITIPVPESDVVLEGIFMNGEPEETPGAVIAPPHPLYGGSLQSPVVGEVAYACRRAGYATVRFNWRGVGASAGAPSGEADDADADYAAALEHLEDTVPGPVIAAGYSFGAAAAVRVAARHPRVRRLVLVAPPPALVDRSLLDAFAGKALLIVGTQDEFAPVSELERWVEDDPRRRLDVIPDADHFFMTGLAAITHNLRSWL
jgi:alpha/beta superfamily hydrolase